MSAAFQRNEFRTYRALNKIHLGKYETDITQDSEFDYDGYTVRYTGIEYGVQQLQGLLGKWFVQVEDQHSTYHARPAGVQVSHATPEARERGDTFSMGEASEEEAVVGTMTEAKQIRKAAAEGDTGRLAQLRASREQRKREVGRSQRPDSNPDAPPPENAADVSPELENVLMEQAERTYTQARPVHQAGNAGVSASPEEKASVARANALNQQRIKQRTAELEALDPYKSKEEMGGTRQDGTGQGGKRVGKGGKYEVVEDDAGVVGAGRDLHGGDAVPIRAQRLDGGGRILLVVPGDPAVTAAAHLLDEAMRRPCRDAGQDHTAYAHRVGDAEGRAHVDRVLHVLQDEDEVDVAAADALEEIRERLAAQLARGRDGGRQLGHAG